MSYEPYNSKQVPEYALRPTQAGRFKAGEQQSLPFKTGGNEYTLVISKLPMGYGIAVYLGQEYIGAVKGAVGTEKEAADNGIQIAKAHAAKNPGGPPPLNQIEKATKKLADELLTGPTASEESGVHAVGTRFDETGKQYISVSVLEEKHAKALRKKFKKNLYEKQPVKIVIEPIAIAQSNFMGGDSITGFKAFKVGVGVLLLIGAGLWLRHIILTWKPKPVMAALPVKAPVPAQIPAALPKT